MIALETARLHIREVEADNLPALLPTYLSNVEYVAMNEGAQGEAGYYDLEMLQRDWWIARMMPGRHMLGLYVSATGEAAGMADIAEEGPSVSMPWLGALLITRPLQRQGLGREALDALAEHCRTVYHASVLRCGVRAENTVGLAFCRALGFTAADGIEERDQRYVVLDRSL